MSGPLDIGNYTKSDAADAANVVLNGDPATIRAALGLGSAATANVTDFDSPNRATQAEQGLAAQIAQLQSSLTTQVSALQSAIAAINTGGSAPTPVSAPVITTGTPLSLPLKVVNVAGASQLQDNSSARFVARGTTLWPIADNGNNAAGNNTFATNEFNNLNLVVQEMGLYGVNVCRVRVLAAYYNSLTSANKTAYVQQVVTVLAALKTINCTLLVEPWDPLDAGPPGFDYSGINFSTQYTQLYPLQLAICAATGNDPYVIWATGNEPNDNSTGSFTAALWVTAQKGLINNLRTACGYTGPILVDPLNWANSGPNGAGFDDTNYTALETYDAGLLSAHHQIMFSTHQYWYPGWANNGTPIAWTLSRFQTTVLGSTATHCIYLSELGYDNLPSSPGAGLNDTWTNAILPDLAGLSATMPNWAGVNSFIWDWVDDNTLMTLSDRQTPTSWGARYISTILLPN